MPDLVQLSDQLRDAVLAQDQSEIERLSAQFQALVDDLEGDIDALSRDIASGNYTQSEIQDLESYDRLVTRAEDKLDGFGSYLFNEFALLAGLWLSLGNTHSTLLIQQSMADSGTTGEAVPIDALLLQSLNTYLNEGGPLYNKLLKYGSYGADKIKQVILDSVGAGLNPLETARLIVASGFGVPLTDAIRMARTLQLYAYRDATIANYNQHSDIVTGWIWYATLTPATCMSCINLHGTFHGLDETLNDHHNGRCAMLPYTGENPVKQSGEDWFNTLSKSEQLQIMGAKKYEAWKAGTISISDMTVTSLDEVYGDMKHEASLKQILEQKGVTQ